jgi:Na+/H+ antiporter NhaC
MILSPLLVMALLLRGRHLLHGLLAGIGAALAVGLGLGLLPAEKLLSLDLEQFAARSVIIDGINRAVGISFFTILLVGLVSALEASGVLSRLVAISEARARTVRAAEVWIVAVVGALVALTCHSIVAILTAAEFTRRTGERFGIHRYRRANLLDVTVSTLPFIAPYFIPVILAANVTSSGLEHGLVQVAPLDVGLHNFFSWTLIGVLVFALATGYGRRFSPDERAALRDET